MWLNRLRGAISTVQKPGCGCRGMIFLIGSNLIKELSTYAVNSVREVLSWSFRQLKTSQFIAACVRVCVRPSCGGARQVLNDSVPTRGTGTVTVPWSISRRAALRVGTGSLGVVSRIPQETCRCHAHMSRVESKARLWEQTCTPAMIRQNRCILTLRRLQPVAALWSSRRRSCQVS